MAEKVPNWRCPFCGHHTTLGREHYHEQWADSGVNSKHGKRAFRLRFYACANRECRELSVDGALAGYMVRPQRGPLYHSPEVTWNLLPAANIKQFPDYVPKAILADYREACLVLASSPKASATLSRRCLQGMIRDFWSVSRPTLHQEINAIKDRVDPETWGAIDSLREIGNVGAHMQHDVNLIVDVEPQEAELLIQLVETLIQDWYVNRHERSKRMNALTTAGQKKKESKRASALPLPKVEAKEPETASSETTAEP